MTIEIKNYAPNGIDGVTFIAEVFDDVEIDITENVVGFSIFENIFSPFLYGHILISDNSAMLSSLPFLGQEKIIIRWLRNDEFVDKVFYSTGIEDVIPSGGNKATYKIRITSEKQFLNASTVFSRSYSQRSDEIIQSIHSEFLNGEVNVVARGNQSFNMIVPYMKPLQAISSILKNSLAEDQSPLFLFDRFYEEEGSTILTSYKQMFEQDPIVELSPKKAVNRITENEQPIELYQVYVYNVIKAFDTLDQISDGSYSATQRSFDISNKSSALDQPFYFKDLAPNLGKEWIKDRFELDRESSRRVNTLRDSLAFDNGLPNIYDVDDLDSLIHKSYMNRLSTIVIDASINPIAYTVEDKEAFTVGKTVDFTVPVYMPITESLKNEDMKNKPLSGKYLITSIRHQMTGREYTMSIELSRDFLGEETII
jgi:hypothetical protein